MPQFHRGIHLFAAFLVGAVLLLITAGGLVKSLEAGLSVPDWPLSYGSLNPPRWWQIETVRSEHGHRLIAGTVALLTIALAVWVGRREERRWVRRLAYLAVATVLAQALLGGLTVLFFLPTAISVSHAAVAQIFLCLIVTIAVATSRWWVEGGAAVDVSDGIRRVAHLATVTTGLIYCQILLGAVMRHTGAGLAIPDFPLAFGGLIPPRFDFAIGIHFAHRLGALLVATMIFWTFGRVLRLALKERRLVTSSGILTLLVLIQGTLGGFVVLTSKAVLPNTLHVGTGGALLAVSLILTLSSWHLDWLARKVREPQAAEIPSHPQLQRATS
ncbi:MAG: cytochrome oxidase assembly protein [Acidobacteria bacterium]|nr:MAG: cytochrome oxidase assembly protein [Acidobacteriota bacterium]